MSIIMEIATRLLIITVLLAGVKATLEDQPVDSMDSLAEGKREIKYYPGGGNEITVDLKSPVPARYEPCNPKNPLGKGFYLPEIDLYSDRTGGTPIFESVDNNCLLEYSHDRQTKENVEFYEDTQSFYNTIASSSSLNVKLTGKYTMGATLDVKTSSISSGSVDVKGNNLRLWTHTQTNVLDDACYRLPNSPLSPYVIKGITSLPLTISNPESSSHWREYENFLRAFGSHVVVKSHYGSSIRSWSFSKITKKYSQRQFQVAACVNFEGPTEVGKLGVNACSNITKEEIQAASSYQMSFNVNVQGGTDETRNKIALKRTKELLLKLMDEGRANPAPVDYDYVAIWNVIKFKYLGNDQLSKEVRAKAENLRQFYEGFKDFGCTEQKVSGVRMRYFRATSHSSSLRPEYECWMEKEGCRSNDDCHVGGAGTVTYCYGNTCMQHKDPEFGNKAMKAVAQTKQTGSYNEKLNRTCYYKFWKAQGYCDNSAPYYHPSRIWPKP